MRPEPARPGALEDAIGGADGVLSALGARKLFRRHYLDLAIMEDVLRDCGLDWTVSR